MPEVILDGTGSGFVAAVTSGNEIKTTVNNSSGNSVMTQIPGVVFTVNSDITPLGANGSFVGDWEEVKDYSIIYASIRTDKDSQDSGQFGMNLEFSQTGSSVDVSEEYFVSSGTTGAIFSTQPSARYFRVNYINGPVSQGLFRLQTLYRPNYGKPSSHRINDPIGDQNDAELSKSVLTAKGDDGIYTNITATSDNSLRVTNIAEGLSIAKGDVANTSFIHKFGAAPDIDVSDGFVTVWDGAEDGTTWEKMIYNYSTTADIQYISSDNAGDTMDLEVQGLDTNFNLITQTKTLTGQTSATLDTPLIRVFRMKNVNGTDFIGHILCSTTTAPAGGIPTTANIRAIIQPGNNQTLMSIFTIPAGKTGYMRDWYASTAGAKRDSQHTIKLLAKPSGGVFQLKHLSNISTNGTSYIQHQYTEPEVFLEKTDIEIRMDTDQDIAGVSAGFDIVLVDN